VAYGFKVLKVDKICAYVESTNPGSIRVAEKAGLKVVSTFPGYRMDEVWLEMQRSEFAGYDFVSDVEFASAGARTTLCVTTQRLFMRYLEASDSERLFQMDSDPRVTATLFG
jgi:RimJ/RimL family protein N-acetyltransferase